MRTSVPQDIAPADKNARLAVGLPPPLSPEERRWRHGYRHQGAGVTKGTQASWCRYPCRHGRVGVLVAAFIKVISCRE